MIFVVIAVAGGCAKTDVGAPAAQDDPEISIACRLDALTKEDRAREAVLLAEHFAQLQTTREDVDGFVFRYTTTPTSTSHLAELVTLEHRCCPFLRFELAWPAGSHEGGPELRISGGPKVKEFIADVFTRKAG